ncbi:MAG TPA: alpha/beta fold hydrolase [Vicinamibacterales bacterium]|nr:alpha/beta fold hydrolase [Vicinamibacterales bacterium]
MPSVHSIRVAIAAAALALPAAAAAQIVPAPPVLLEANATSFTIFVGGRPLGSEQVAVSRVADGWMISSTGRIGAPVDVVARRVQVIYTADWRPLSFDFDGTVRGQSQTVHTVVNGTTATSNITIGGQTTQKTDTIDPAALLVLTNGFFGPYEAVSTRIRTSSSGTELPVYGEGPMVNMKFRVGDSAVEQIQTTARLVSTRRTALTMLLPGATVDANIWSDDAGRLVRFNVPGQSVDVVREDVAAVSSRTVTISRPNDERITIPSIGFTLAGTVSRPATSAAPKLPAVVLVGGTGPADRDGVSYGVPILGELAAAIADAGFIVVRYDKRGIGQSGGRPETASLVDYAEDVRAAVKALTNRKDVDPQRVALVGHGEGGLVALIAASKEKRVDAVALASTPGMSGADVALAQQQRMLDRMKLSPEERQAKVDEQKRIHEAAITGKGADQLPPAVRRSIENAEYQSVLSTDPAKLMKDVKQPLLIVQGELDSQVDPKNADMLADYARQRKSGATDVVKLPGVNHLLAAAMTGEVDEYGALQEKHVAPAVTQAIVTWLQKTLSTAR